MKNWDKLMEEMEKAEKEKRKPVISDEEKQRRLAESQQIRALLSKVEPGVIKLEERDWRGAPQVKIDNREVNCLHGFYFSIAEPDQGVGEDGLWKCLEKGQVFLDISMPENQEIRWAYIRFVRIEDKSMFLFEIYLKHFPIADEELVELLSGVPIKGGKTIDNFEQFKQYVQWFITKYIEDKREIQTEEQRKDNIFQRIIKKKNQ